MLRGNCGVLRLHVARHPATMGEIGPFRYFLDHSIRMTLPGKTIGAMRFLLADRRLVEPDLNLFADEMTHFNLTFTVQKWGLWDLP